MENRYVLRYTARLLILLTRARSRKRRKSGSEYFYKNSSFSMKPGNISAGGHTGFLFKELGKRVYRKTFYYGVYPYRPVVREDEPTTDFMIGISVVGKRARLSRICVEYCDGTGQKVPALFIGGDSTVRDYEGLYPYNPLTNGGSWGQSLLQYLDGMAVCNQAHSGLTTNCFRPDDPLTLEELASFAVRGLHPWAERNLGLSECIKEAQALGWIESSGLEPGRRVTRAESIEMTVRMYCEKELLGQREK